MLDPIGDRAWFEPPLDYRLETRLAVQTHRGIARRLRERLRARLKPDSTETFMVALYSRLVRYA